MSSSTMIHGATAWRENTYRIPVDSATTPTSQAQTGTARAKVQARAPARPATAVSTAKPDLVQPRRELRGRRIVGLDPNVCGCIRHVLQHRVANGRTARGLFERGRIQVGHAGECVLTLGQG